jgi:3-oxoacyl-[acyl-carrier protein] reductase
MTESRIDGHVAVVTGSTKGIGRGVAEALLREGARVVISARNADEVAAVAAELGRGHAGRVLGQPCDVRREKDVAELFHAVDRTWAGLDILVNNAGVGFFKRMEETSLEEWNRILETNLTGVFLCSRAAIPRMRTRGGGYILNISSLAGKNAFPEGTAYNASKFGLNGMSEGLMQEVRYDGIKVSYIMPGSVSTYFNDRAPKAGDEWKLQPEDVARVVVDLLRHDPRSLPSRVEMRPSRPPRK